MDVQSGIKRVAHGSLMRHLALVGQLRADERYLEQFACQTKLSVLRSNGPSTDLVDVGQSPFQTAACRYSSASPIIIDNADVDQDFLQLNETGELPYRLDLMLQHNIEEQVATWQSLLTLFEKEAQGSVLVELEPGRTDEESSSAVSRRSRRRRLT